MSIADQVIQLETELARVKKELAEIREAVEKLPRVPPGFRDGHAERIKWSERWVKDNWAIKQEAEEWRQRALRAESAVEACVCTCDSVTG